MPTELYDPPRFEYLDGEPHQKVSPKTRHGIVQFALGGQIQACAGGRGVVLTEGRCYPPGIDPTSLVPDVAFVSRERFAALSPEGRDRPPFSPDIAAEIRSPGDDMGFLARKIARYLATGSVLVLDVDPATRSMLAHAANGVTAFAPGSTFSHPAVPWLRFELRALFTELDDLGL